MMLTNVGTVACRRSVVCGEIGGWFQPLKSHLPLVSTIWRFLQSRLVILTVSWWNEGSLCVYFPHGKRYVLAGCEHATLWARELIFRFGLLGWNSLCSLIWLKCVGFVSTGSAHWNGRLPRVLRGFLALIWAWPFVFYRHSSVWLWWRKIAEGAKAEAALVRLAWETALRLILAAQYRAFFGQSWFCWRYLTRAHWFERVSDSV